MPVYILPWVVRTDGIFPTTNDIYIIYGGDIFICAGKKSSVVVETCNLIKKCCKKCCRKLRPYVCKSSKSSSSPPSSSAVSSPLAKLVVKQMKSMNLYYCM